MRIWYFRMTLLLSVVVVSGFLIINKCGSPGSSGTNEGSSQTSKAITFFFFTSPAAIGVVDENTKTINVTVPAGTDLNNMIAGYITTGASVTVNSITQTSGITVNNFTTPLIYRVTAEDSSTADYTVTVIRALPNNKAITLFVFASPFAIGYIDEGTKTIAITVPHGTIVTSLVATFITTGKSVSVDGVQQVSGVTAVDYSAIKKFIVKGEDGSEATYNVTVTVALSSAKQITAFSILGINAAIDEAYKTITVRVPNGTSRSSLVATFSITGNKLMVNDIEQTSGFTANDFSNEITYKVIAEDLSSINYTVTVTSCDDMIINGNESDIDCGGSCNLCVDGKTCVSSTDCSNSFCFKNTCVSPTCNDMVKNGTETDIDCGGSCPDKCAIGKVCGTSADCTSGVCTSFICKAPTCSDRVKNGTETDIDCGGSCGPCVDGKTCLIRTDCMSGVCINFLCKAPTCNDMVKNGIETDIDCGGSCPDKCEIGNVCRISADCMSGVCTNYICKAPTCSDKVKNGTETDIDCGGSCPDKCAIGKVCRTSADCISGVCTDFLCKAPTCSDMVKNGTETDIDCGGSCPDKCEIGKVCKTSADCISGNCNASYICQ